MPPPRQGGKDATKDFEKYFTAQYPNWSKLYAALLKDTSHVAVQNAFCGEDQLELGGCSVAFEQGALRIHKLQPGVVSGPPPALHPTKKLLTHYWLDMASVLPVLLLGATSGHSVLDMCAAPGGKSLMLAMCLFSMGTHYSPDRQVTSEPSHAVVAAARKTQLVSNEMDRARRARLAKVLDEYIPPLLVGASGDPEEPSPVRVTGYSADVHWARREAGEYDRVLLDAPCTSERHVVQQSHAGGRRGGIVHTAWSAAGCKKAADLQVRLLMAGLRALRTGGRLVYSTCSLASQENDWVVSQALSRCAPGSIVILPPAEAAASSGLPVDALSTVFGAQPTQHGVLCTPEKDAGYGPIYTAVIEKVGEISLKPVMAQLGSEDESEEEEGEGQTTDVGVAGDAALAAVDTV